MEELEFHQFGQSVGHMYRLPKVCTVVAIPAATWLSSATSQRMASAWCPASRISCWAAVLLAGWQDDGEVVVDGLADRIEEAIVGILEFTAA